MIRAAVPEPSRPITAATSIGPGSGVSGEVTWCARPRAGIRDLDQMPVVGTVCRVDRD